MEKLHLENDIAVFGKPVPSFPKGIGETFDELVNALPDGRTRSYYGISRFRNGQMEYFATTQERHAGEAEKLGLHPYTIEKGDYLTETVHGWRDKTDKIKDVFAAMMRGTQCNPKKPAIEWYKNDEEMLCMVKANRQADK